MNWIRFFRLLLTGATLFPLVLLAWKLDPYGEFAFRQMGSSNVWIMHGPAMEPNRQNKGFMNNPAFIEGKRGLIVIDPGGNAFVGAKVLEEIEKVSKKPIAAILNTHKHGDHWFANIALAQKYPNAPIYAHPNMIREVKAGEAEKWYGILERLTGNLQGTRPFRYPAHELRDGQVLEIDGERFRIFHPKRAHTDTDLLILHENSDTLFLGDNVMKNRLGGFDASSSILGNIELLEGIMKGKEHRLYVPGHGPSGAREETVGPFLRYLKLLADEAKKAYEADEEYYSVKKEAIAKMKEFQNWDAFDHQMGKHLGKVYQEIEERDMQ